MQMFVWRWSMSCCYAVLICFTVVNVCLGQTDNVGSGRAISFDGIDDLVNYGDTYKDLKYPFTISAWIYLDPSTNTAAPIFSNRNCDPVYTGFRLIVNANVISLDYGDGLGGNSPAFRRGIQATVDYLPGSWNHITAVVENMNSMRLYLNGINVGGSLVGNSALPMDSSKPGFGSTAYFISNGTIYRFKGIIDEIRLWNKALTEADVKSTMCVKLTGTEPGLIGYWNCDEIGGTTIFDKTSSHVNGSFENGPNRVYSGAPVGDESTFVYSTNMTGKYATLSNGHESFAVDNIDNLAGGVQLYYVRSSPSQTTGLDTNGSSGYFGAFLAKQGQTYRYNITQVLDGVTSCSLYSRSDNSAVPWRVMLSPPPRQDSRGEYLYKTSGTIAFELGKDTTVCNASSLKISTDLSSSYSFKWSTGQTTPSIDVASGGMYKVKVQGSCGMSEDSIKVIFFRAPQPFSLGEDYQQCPPKPILLSAPFESEYSYEWHDGSTHASFAAFDYGLYWVKVSNVCGYYADTIELIKPIESIGFIPNVITPNGDMKNETFVVGNLVAGEVSLKVINRWGNEVYFSSDYKNDWNANEVPPGVYFIELFGSCVTKRHEVLNVLKSD